MLEDTTTQMMMEDVVATGGDQEDVDMMQGLRMMSDRQQADDPQSNNLYRQLKVEELQYANKIELFATGGSMINAS